VAVLGCGVDVAYPLENRRLLQEIVDGGGVVISEYEPGTNPLPAFFPARNRIISGLAEGTLVVEAAARSGSLITAEMALSAGRDVYAIPGSIYAPGCDGCNRLIQQGAKLVMTPADVLEEFQITAAAPPRKSLSLKPEERQIYQVLSFEHPLTMDEIILSLPDGEIANLSYWLLNMELKGIVIENEMHAFRRAERE
jgi:DNA processing protein